MDMTGITFAVLASVAWGLVYTIDQKILGLMSPLAWLAISSLIAAIITLPVLFLHQEEIKAVFQSGRNNVLLMIGTQFLIVLATLFIFSAIKHLGAVTANIFEITYPLFVVIFSLLMFGGRISLSFGVGALFIFLGSLIIIKFS